MTHLEAIESRAAERYALQQMNAAEAEDFEQHFFTCFECAEEVRWVSMFEANAKKIVGRKVRATEAEFVSMMALSPGKEPVFRVTDHSNKVVFAVTLPGGNWRAKHVSLATGAGTSRFTIAVPEEDVDGDKVHVLMSARELDPGRHVLTLVSEEGDLEEYGFTVVIE
jgi:glycine/D-amino acid oxidase-like deaminating enzyme